MDQTYFFIKKNQLKDKKIFPFQVYVYHMASQQYYLYLKANMPLTSERSQLLEEIIEKGGKIAIRRDQSLTLLQYLELHEDDIPSLKIAPPTEQELVSRMFQQKVKMAETRDGPFNFVKAFQSACQTNDFQKIIEKAWDEILAFSPYVSKSTSLASLLAEKREPHDNEVNRICACSYFFAKNLNIKNESALGDLVSAAFLHHIGMTQIPLTLLRTPHMKLSDAQRKVYRQHVGLSEHLLKKIPLTWDGEMLMAIKDHHERASRMGFPEQKGEGHINLLSAIIGLFSHLFEFSAGRVDGQSRPLDIIMRKILHGHLMPGLETIFCEYVDDNIEALCPKDDEKKALQFKAA
jgi:HD-GYP domain-containing protein (c-di-GMP phosphodiesterase class II)